MGTIKMRVRMDRLATYFVSIVVFAHAIFPQANLPAVLGVSVAKATDATPTPSAQTDASVTTSRLEALQAARETRQQALEAARLRRQQALEGAQARQEEFRASLSLIRDERKAATVEQLNNKLAAMNARFTTRFDHIITRLTELLAKIVSRTDKAEERGYDVTVVREAITTAEAAIETAQAAVNAQAEKVYIIEITDEERLGQAVQEAISLLKADIKATRGVVADAKEAVHAVLKALADLRGVDET